LPVHESQLKPTPFGSELPTSSAADVTTVSKQQGKAARLESKLAVPEPSAPGNGFRQGTAKADDSMIPSAAPTKQPACKAGQQSALFASATAFSKPSLLVSGSRTHHRERSAMALKASRCRSCLLLAALSDSHLGCNVLQVWLLARFDSLIAEQALTFSEGQQAASLDPCQVSVFVPQQKVRGPSQSLATPHTLSCCLDIHYVATTRSAIVVRPQLNHK